MSIPPPPPGPDRPSPGFGAPPPLPPSPAPLPSYGGPSYAGPSYGAPPPGYQPYQQGYGAAEHAGFGARLLALIIDGIVMALISAPLTIGAVVSLRKALEDCVSIDYGDRTELLCGDQGVNGTYIALAVVLYLAALVLTVWLYGRWVGKRQTPGQKAMHIRVVDANSGGPIGTGRAIGRYFARILSGIPCGLGFLWMLWDGKKQTWHDKMVTSIVVKA